MVQISRTTTWLHWLWSWSWYVGDRVHNGRTFRWLTLVSRWFRNGSAVSDPESARSTYQRTNGVIQQEPKVCRTEVPRNHKTWNSRKAIYDFFVKESSLVDDWPTLVRSSRSSDWGTSLETCLLRWYQRTRSRRGAEQFDRSSPETHLLVIVENHLLRLEIWKHLPIRLVDPAHSWLKQSKIKRLCKYRFPILYLDL